MIVLNFGPDACSDCHRPSNAGGVHNAGCAIVTRRLCCLCESMHDEGEDAHRNVDGNYCTIGLAVATKVYNCPGWTRDQCVAEVDRRMAEHKLDLDVYAWLKTNPINEDVLAAAVRGFIP